jgi:hypothetical protein
VRSGAVAGRSKKIFRNRVTNKGIPD